jgi:hypothetical protein
MLERALRDTFYFCHQLIRGNKVRRPRMPERVDDDTSRKSFQNRQQARSQCLVGAIDLHRAESGPRNCFATAISCSISATRTSKAAGPNTSSASEGSSSPCPYAGSAASSSAVETIEWANVGPFSS